MFPLSDLNLRTFHDVRTAVIPELKYSSDHDVAELQGARRVSAKGSMCEVASDDGKRLGFATWLEQ